MPRSMIPDTVIDRKLDKERTNRRYHRKEDGKEYREVKFFLIRCGKSEYSFKYRNVHLLFCCLPVAHINAKIGRGELRRKASVDPPRRVNPVLPCMINYNGIAIGIFQP